MPSHRDQDHQLRREFLKELELRAEIMTDLAKNDLQQGQVLQQWKHDGVTVQNLPDDRQHILRISIGGGDHLPIHGDYCNFRGDQSKCIQLLTRCLEAMKQQ